MSRPVIVWLLLAIIWGSTWLFIKLGLQDLPPFTFAGLRFIIASSILLVVVAVRRAGLPRRRKDWGLIAVTGLLSFTCNYGLVFWGEQHISSGLAALLQAMTPMFGLVIAHHYLPQERMTASKVAGVLLGIMGVGIIFSNQMKLEGGLALWGSAALVVSALAAAYANVLVKARGGHLDPEVLAAGQMIFGLIPLMTIGIIVEGNPLAFRWTRMAVIAIFYLALVGSSVAFMLYYWLVRHMDVTKTMLIALVTPVIAVTLGMIVLGEGLTWRLVLGGASILAGITLIVTRKVKGERGETRATKLYPNRPTPD